MNIEKIKLDDIRRCYCASHVWVDNQFKILFASEDPTSTCFAYSGENFKDKELVWNDRGGCMSIIQIPNTNGEFLAINEFYLKVSPSQSKLVWGKYTENGWVIKDLFSLPYLHRFDIYNKNGVNYLVCATIAEDKEYKDDWRKPGQIYVAVLPSDLDKQEIHLNKLLDGYYRNHGYYRHYDQDGVCGYFSSDQGVIKLSPPKDKYKDWNVEKILDGAIGEIALIDINNDGIDEIMTIEPFHGNKMKIYEFKNGSYQSVFDYPHEVDFAHTLIGRPLGGKNSFIGGVRRINSELFYIQYIDGEYRVKIIEEKVGPANIDVVNFEDFDLIISANHTKDEASVYIVRD